MWQKVTRTSAKYGLQSEITSFVDVDGAAEIELVRIKNISEEVTKITPIAAIPLYGRSADNIRESISVNFFRYIVLGSASS